jgi:adenylate cyclase
VTATVAAALAHYLYAQPSKELAEGMAAIEEFAATAREVPMTSHVREIFRMQSAFNSMKVALQGFAKFAPVHVVKKLLADHVEAKLRVEETVATAFFSDIEGFTTISEREAPETLIATLAEYFNAMTAIVLARNGIVGDFIGDAVFAFWNSPAERQAQHALLACESAMDQQEQLVQLREAWKDRGMPQFKIRIGINTGPCLAGNVGSEQRMKYTLIGDTVNLAARLEGIGKHYRVNLTVSMATYTSPGVRETFVGRVLDVVKVVGKREPTKILTLIARRASATAGELEGERLSWLMIEAYVAGRLEEARSWLDEMHRLLPDDYSVHLMTEKVTRLQATGLPAGWNGATAMTEK